MEEYPKPALKIDEQIKRLESRGMIIGDKCLARQRLSHINYYRLSAYWEPFEELVDNHAKVENRSDVKIHVNPPPFRAGTSFDEVLDDYYFDHELRLLMMEAIGYIEISVRKQWAYHLAITHGVHAHLNSELFTDEKSHEENVKKLKKELSRSTELFIKEYRNKYSGYDYPVWMAAEIMSLGLLSRWYGNLKCPALQQKMAGIYKLNGKVVLASFLHHITLIRNLCAHHSRLWNRHLVIHLKCPSKEPPHLVQMYNREAPEKNYNAIVTTAYLVKIIRPDVDWGKRLVLLLRSQKHDLAKNMGVPEGWHDNDFWN